MNSILRPILILIFSGFAGAFLNPLLACDGTFNTAIPDNNSTGISETIINSGSVGTIGGGTTIQTVCVLIDHTFLSDLTLTLQCPSGAMMTLSAGNGFGFDDYGDVAGNVEVCFSPTASTSISLYSGGLTGNWLPDGLFSDFNGCTANGNWTLSVADNSPGDTGTLISWSMTFSNGNCVCAADAGTVTTSTGTNSISLCVGDSFTLTSNDDYVLPSNEVGEVSELMYALYDCVPPVSPDPLNDACWSGVLFTAEDVLATDAGATNTAGGVPFVLQAAGVTGTNGTTVWWVPVTVDDGNDGGDPNGVVNIDQNGDQCYASGTPIEVIYFEDVTITFTDVCDPVTGMGSITYTINGGSPGSGVGTFSVTNTGAGTIAPTSGIADGGTFTASGLTNLDVSSFTITDGFGCSYGPFSVTFDCGNDACLNGTTLTVDPPASSFPNNQYPPNTTVEFCFDINQYLHTDLNFLAGIVPSFGGGWDPVSITNTLDPMVAGNNEVGSSWQWLPGNTVDYNSTSALIPDAGWWFLSINSPGAPPAPTDPDGSWGDGCTAFCYPTTQAICNTTPQGQWISTCGCTASNPGGLVVGPGVGADISDPSMTALICASQNGTWNGTNCVYAFGGCFANTATGYNYTWSSCFELTTVDELTCSPNQSVTVSVKTYSDGETGAWTDPACTVDQAVTFAAEICCIPEPSFTPPSNICEGQSITLTASPDNLGVINWYDVPTGGLPLLTNSNSITLMGLGAGTYTYYAEEDINGCLSLNRAALTFTVNPLVTIVEDFADKNICLGESAVIQTTITNGIAPTWSSVPGGPLPAYDGMDDITVTPTVSTVYTVSVTNFCGTTTLDFSVTVNPVPLVTASGNDATCSGICDGDATAAPVGGTAPYTYLWSGGETDQNATGLCSGTHTLTLTDFAGCTATTTVTIGELGNLNIDNTSSTEEFCDMANGTGTVTVSGGTAPYIYLWDNAQTTQTATGLAAGSYTVTINDSGAGTGCTATAMVTVTEIQGPNITNVFVLNASCGSPGSIIILANGGTPPLEYSNGGAFQSSSTITGVAPGTYTVTVRDALGCTATTSTTVGGTSGVNVSVTFNSDALCNGSSDGSATAAGSAGTAPYTYLWDSGSTDATATNLNAGTHVVTVTDATMCPGTASVIISEPTLLLASASETTPASCNGNSDGSATASATDGTPGYTFAWSNGQTTAVATGLPGGPVTVTVTDANMCTATASTTINEPAAVTASANVSSDYNGQDIECNGSATGEITATAGGGMPPYTYLWSDVGAQTNLIATGLSAGTYVVTITDVNTCTATASATLIDPPILVSPTSVTSNYSGEDISCFGANDGEVTVTPSGGNMSFPYTYLWNDAGSQTTAVATGLSAGTYTVTVSDINSCTSTSSVTVTEPLAIGLSITLNQNVSCNSFTDGSATANPSGGTPAYTFLWDNGNTNANATDLGVGIHIVTLTDQNGCSITSSTTLSEPSAITLSVTSNTPANCTSCDGTADILVGGGSLPYTFLWSNGNTNEDPADLCSGNNVVTVTDMNGCSITTSTTIGNSSTLTIDVTTIDNHISCNGLSDGQATASVSGGQMPYTYIWSSGSTTATAAGLAAGSHGITVTDFDGCISVDNIVINEPNALVSVFNQLTTVSCNGQSDGSADVSVSGGTMAYTYNWDNGSTTATATGLSGGVHSVTITDANMCTVISTGTITEPAALLASITPVSDVNCNGASDGSATASGSGGSPAYTFLWDNGETTGTATGLSAGTHTITITDANMCTATASSIVSEPSLLGGSIIPVSDVSCNSLADGSATASGSGGTPAYTFQWDSGETTATATNLSGGLHTVTITDSNSCETTQSISVFEPSILSVSTSLVSDASCNGFSDGSASASGSGGTPAYTYSWDNGETNSTATNLTAGTHTVTVTDNNMCTATNSIIISEPSALTSSISPVSDVSCNGANDGSATASGSGGSPAYTFTWDNGETNATAVALSGGPHTVTVTDANSCVSTATITINESSSLTLSITPGNDVSCNGGGNGSATASPGGGSPAYTFAWDNGETSFTATGLSGGTHVLTLTDSNMCSETASIVISEPAALTATTSFDNDVSCNGASDGGATASGSGGTPVYTYAWDNGETTASATGLSGGTHVVTITDSNMCSETANIVISEPTAISLTVTLNSNVSCNGANDGSATASGSGGLLPYTFAWDNGETTGTAISLSGGTHTVTLTDANTCTSTGSVLVSEPTLLTASGTEISGVSCNGGSDGSASAAGMGGSIPYTYAWDNGATGSTATNLTGGLHIITVTDNNACATTTSVNIAEPIIISVSANLNNHISCNGANDGSATAVPFGGNPAYTFTWDNGETTATAINLGPGSHTVSLTDMNNCLATAIININEPSALSVATGLVSNVSCNGNSDGSASAAGSGGTPLYTYLWDSGETTSLAIGLTSGIHVVTITDANMCSATSGILISEPSALSASTALLNGVSCNGAADGSASAAGLGGTSPYTFAWDNGETTAVAAALSGGIHIVTVTDTNACFTTASVNVSEPSLFSASASLNNDISCFGFSDGSATASGSGGSLPYTFAWDNGVTNATATNLNGGAHTVTLTDMNGCAETASVTITEPAQLNLSTSLVNDVNCNGQSDGSASATATGGTPAYTYNWDNGETTATAANLNGGVHTITLTDANGCTTTSSVLIGEPAALSGSAVADNDVSCNGASDGQATVTPSGGTPAYTYNWDNGMTTAIASGLSGGVHVVTLTDQNGCTITTSVLIGEPAVLSAQATANSDATCNGASDGSATASGTGGTPAYTFSWDNGETDATATQLTAGSHVVTLSDQNGCTSTASVTITEPGALSGSAVEISGVSCSGASDGSAAAAGIGGSPPYTYAWDNTETTSVATALTGGNHVVTITDSNTCETTASVLITEPVTMTVTTTVVSDVSCTGANDGSATATPAGGTPAYTYAWDNGETTGTAIALSGGAHTVTVSDQNGCSATATISISEPGTLTAPASVVSGVSCNGANDGSATATPAGGTPAYTYAWDNGETTGTAIGLSGGAHTVTVSDQNGCSVTASVTITEPAALGLSTSINNDVSCNGQTDGSATATASGGSPAYTYSWDSGETTATATALSGGAHTITLTDMNGCTETASVTITEPAQLTGVIAINSTVSCNGQTDGSATATPSGGSPAYTYSWDTAETTATATGLGAGAHTVTVTDQNICSITLTVMMTEPMALTAAANLISDAACAGSADGSASVTVTGGTPGYTYNWDSGETNLVASALNAGTHTVTVTDQNGCVATSSVLISEPTALTVSVDATTAANCTSCDGTADITIGGGTPPYTYSWSNGNTSQDPADLCSGGNAVTVSDANGCESTATATVGNTSTLLIDNTNVTNDVSCNGGSDGSAVTTVSGGQMPYTYSWSNGSTITTATGLSVGNYTVTVTDFDGCIAVDNITVTEPMALLALGQVVNDVGCNGASDGQAEVLVSGGTPAYTYIWSTGSTDMNATGLIAGAYTVTVTDQNTCTVTASVTISEPGAISVTTNEDNGVSCNGLADGQATASPLGGSPAYTYNWDNGETDATATALTGGIHTVTVTDMNGCTETADVTITEPAALGLLMAVTAPISCASATDGAATATPSGGTPVYTYTWSNGSTDQTATGLGAGSYDLTVTDQNSCSETATILLTEPPAIGITVDGTTDANCTSCDGTASITITGGIAPYTYLWTNGNTTEDPIDLCSGANTVTVTDTNGCTQTAGITTGNMSTLTVGSLIVDNDVSCNGLSDGQATASGAAGQPPYLYIWSTGATDATATGLAAGPVTVTISDSDGCVATGSVMITEPAALSTVTNVIASVSCAGASDGSADVLGLGGTPAYTYSWDSGETTATATALSAGPHTVTLTDQNGCTTTDQVTISEPPALTATVDGTTSANCTSCDGTASITPAGGTPPYTYQWSNGNTNEDPMDLCSGGNVVTITDQNGCAATATATVGNTSTLLIDNITVDSDVSCAGVNDGQATATVSGGQPPYVYMWDSGSTDATATGLIGGSYNLTVTDQDGCIAVDNVTISEPAAITLIPNVISHISCTGADDGSAEVLAIGGTIPYTYNWDNGETVNPTVALGPGPHTVTVTDANNCSETASVMITEPTPVAATITIDNNPACAGDSDGSATVNASGGTAPFTFAWSNGDTDVTATGLIAGAVTVTVTDGSGCTETASAVLTEPAALIASITIDNNVSCFGAGDGQATLTATGGTAPYTYSWDNGATDATAPNLGPGMYNVTLTDANACSETATATITEPAAITSVTSLINDVTCNGDGDGSASVLVSGGTIPYTYVWTNGETDATATALSGGTQTVTITDMNGCTHTTDIVITEPAALGLSFTVVGESCFGNDGSADAMVTGGTTPYTYSWDTGATDQAITGLVMGSYNVTITDMNGCSETGNVIVPDACSCSMMLAMASTDALCNGDANGTATVTPTLGTMPYVYSWSNGDTDATATGLAAGPYTVTVVDAVGCNQSLGVTIIEPSVLTSSASVLSDVSCNGGADGSATTTPGGGTAPYTYSWDSGSTDATATNLTMGSHDVTVTDMNGCTETANVVLSEPSALTLSVDGTTTANCTSCDGTASITSGGGTPPYTYLWSNGNTDEDPADLCSGGNSVTVTDMNGCQITANATVGNTSTLVVDNVTVDSDVSCNGANDGQATATVSGGQMPYTYIWSNGSTDITATGLNGGSYNITVTDFDGCIAVDNVTINEPAAISLIPNVLSPVTCQGGSNGSAEVLAIGGTAPYTYNWDNAETDNPAIALDAGPHNVTVTDMNGCTETTSVMITEPSALGVTVDGTTTANCTSCDGTASITPTGGTMPYTYLWSNGNTTEDPLDLCSGTNDVTLTDANGCQITATSTVGNTSTLVIDNVTVDNNVSCNGAGDGQATVLVSGGQIPYTYIWDSGSTDATATGLGGGNFNVTVTDTDGCIVVGTVMIGEPLVLNAPATVDNDVSCFGASDGQATLTATGGTAPYTYSWDNGATDATAPNLGPGMYNVTLTDANACSETASVSIAEPSAITSVTSLINDVTCNGDGDGSASVLVSGGTIPYTYVWTNGETDATATALSGGTQTVTITDMNGCTHTTDIVISEPAALGLSFTVVGESCFGNDGSADAMVTGGTTPYTYSWDTGATDQAITGLVMGSYNVTITDMNGCSETGNVIVPDACSCSMMLAMASTNVLCNGEANGTATVTPTLGTMPYAYTWSTGSTDATTTGLVAGPYTVTVSDAVGCEETANVTIVEPPVLTSSASVLSDVSCNGGADGSATTTPVGGTAPYTFAWDSGATDATATNLTMGNHDVTVTDMNGCTATASVSLTEPTAVAVTVDGTTQANCTSCDGTASITPAGGTPPYTYLWSSGSTLEDPVDLCSGGNAVTVTDANGCVATGSAMVGNTSTLLVDNITVDSDVSCNGAADGQATATVSGGQMPYTYLWSNGATDLTATGLNGGSFNITVTDFDGCIAVNNVTINEPAAISLIPNVLSPVTCQGGSDGSAEVLAIGGTAPYTYNWDNGETDNPAIALDAGSHNVTVTDMNGCTETTSVMITEPSALGVTVDGTTTANCTSCDGTASITPTGGTMPYTYLWSNGNTTEDPLDLCSGTNDVTLTDANGCQATATSTIGNTSTLVIDNVTVDNNVSCNGAGDGQATATVSGGNMPYTYLWDSGSTDATATGLGGGNFNVTVNDADGCVAVGTVMIGEPMVISILMAVVQDVGCAGGNDGQATASPSGGTAPYTYSWDIGETDATATNLTMGNHDVTVTDMNGCTGTANVTLTEPAALTLVINTTSTANCTSCDGAASITAGGGTMPYTYLWSSGSTTEDPIDLCSGTNDVTVTDANGCAITASTTIANTSTLVIDNVTVDSDVSCNGAADGQATATVSGGQIPYTYIWSNGSTDATATGLGGGSFDLTVTDGDGCIAVDNVTIAEPSAMTVLTALNNDVSCTGGSDGSATASPSGGILPYTYAWDSGETDATATALSAGLIQVTVTDGNMCATTASLMVNEPPNGVTITVDGQTSSNCSSCDGTVSITVTGGNAPYTYSWDNTNTTEDPTDLCAGMNTVTVTDAGGCSATASVNIGNTSSLVIDNVLVDANVSCNGGSDGGATVMASGGQIPYTYVWSNTMTDQTITGLVAGTYDVTVTDTDGCVAAGSVMISEPAALAIPIAVDNDVSCAGGADGSATASPAGGTAPYTYTWDSGETDATATMLNPGTHIVTVTDANMCSETATTSITEPTALAVTLDGTTTANCTSCDGTASITSSGGTPPYTYLWSNGNTTEDPIDLCSGTNDVTVTDANGCAVTATSTVGNTSTLLVDAVNIDANVTCNGGSDGAASVIASSGNPPYTYSWSNGSTDVTATGLMAGPITVSVTDMDGCIAVGTANVGEPMPLMGTATVDQDVQCNGASDGQATVVVTGGTAPYTYSWTNGETTATATMLDAGSHIVIINDANGCVTTAGVIVTEPPLFGGGAMVDNNVACAGETTGAATASPIGGTPPYTYVWTSGQTDQQATMLPAGIHGLTITDANMCAVTATIDITEPAVLTTTATEDTPVTCFGESDGAASTATMGGTAPYTFAWDNGATDASTTGLPQGNIGVTVTDANMCMVTATVLITQPPALSAGALEDMPVSCAGASDGQATASVGGGVAPYTFNWDNGVTDAVATNLDAGIHSITLTDANLCTITATVDITEPAPLMVAITEDSPASCAGNADATATATPSGGSLPYTYSWDNGETDQTITNLAAGTHVVTVTDMNLCTVTGTVAITEPAPVLATATEDMSVSCFGGNDGQATVTAGGGTAPFTFVWDNGETEAQATALMAGTHTVTLTDAGFCSATATVDITEPNILVTNISEDQAVSCNGDSDGAASAGPVGGTMPYTYSWDNGGTDAATTGLVAGPHFVTITDANMCTVTASVDITEPTALTASATEDTPVSCAGGSDGAATVTGTGGTPPYTFSWDNGGTDQTATNLTAGLHQITVTDMNGCATTTGVNTTEPLPLATTIAQDQPVSCAGDTNGSATATPSGGTAPYTFSWDSSETDATATALNAGIHSVTITDANMCTLTETVEITEPAPLTIATAEVSPASCAGSSDASAIATPSGGTTPYTYIWDSSETTATATALAAGTHTVTVTDANLCTTTASVLVTEPAAIAVTLTQVQGVSCTGEADGISTATPTGGTMPYTYNWDSGETDATATALNAGTHQITVTDANMCSVTATIDITEPLPLSLIVTEDQSVSCAGEADGVALATPSDGTAPYTYEWSTGESDATATGLIAGDYTVTLTDMNGCTTTGMVTITEPTVLAVIATAQSVSCFGAIDGQATATVSGGTPAYTFAWDNGEISNPAIFLSGGTHTVTVTDMMGCTVTTSVDVPSPLPLIPLGISSSPTTCFGGDDGSATVGAEGGTAPYTFTWSDGQTGTMATGLTAGVYSVVISDANGCALPPISITVGQPAQSVIAAATGTDPSCFEGNDGSATATAQGGTPSYQFSWSDGSVGPTAFGLTQGTYTVTVTDLNGCEDVASITLGQPNEVVSMLTANANICFGDANGSIVIDTSFGGSGPYVYSLDGENFTTSNIFAGLTAGQYEVWTQDINGCETSQTILIDEPFEITVGLEAVIEVVLGDSVTLRPQVNTTDSLTYLWSPPQFLSCITCEEPVATPLETTIYTVMVADSNGCAATAQVEVIVDKSRDVYIPNAFSPNGDGTNDVFMIYGNQGVASVRMFRVFDRWGELVHTAENFQPNDPTFGWNGTLKGTELNPAVFVYFAEVEFVDGVTIMYKGDVTLIK